MGVYDLYSKRRKRELGDVVDVYTYDVIPLGLRNQVVHIWHEVIGLSDLNSATTTYREAVRAVYQNMAQALRREYGLVKLSHATNIDPNNGYYASADLEHWLLNEKSVERVLDGIEMSFRVIQNTCSRNGYLNRSRAGELGNAAIEELNIRFKEHGVGYQFISGEIIRVDSELIHTEAVVPALAVLRGPEYSNAQAEFLSAFEHFRHGDKQEALVDCCKCFESTMKVICNKRGWTYDTKATASQLVKVCLDNGLIASYWQTHLTGLRSVLESAIPTPRNKQGGHGAGIGPAPELPESVVSFALHMTASTVLFLVESERKLAP